MGSPEDDVEDDEDDLEAGPASGKAAEASDAERILARLIEDKLVELTSRANQTRLAENLGEFIAASASARGLGAALTEFLLEQEDDVDDVFGTNAELEASVKSALES
jgi:hypothetical protein